MTKVGARPQFVKAAVLSRALVAAGLTEHLVHTGQHYDDALSGSFFRDLCLPEPTINLGVGSGTHGGQTTRMLEGIESACLQLHPELVVVLGDTNSTLAGALAAVKLRIPVAHVEAGLRAGGLGMPEEANRLVADRLSSLLFAPTAEAAANLVREGHDPSSIHLVGDVMVDALRTFAPADPEPFLVRFGVARRGFVFATLHRAENTDNPVRLVLLLAALDAVARDLPVVFCVHPRTRARIAAAGWSPRYLTIHEPADYRTSLALSATAAAVATDSGGVQKEAAVLGTPVVLLRDRTEWRELVDRGWRHLWPQDGDLAAAIAIASPGRPLADLYGGGLAAQRIAAILATQR